MSRSSEIAERMADVVLKRLVARKVIEARDDRAARAAIKQAILDNLMTEQQIDADARKLLLEHAKAIRESAADYRQLVGKVREKLARERGFVL